MSLLKIFGSDFSRMAGDMGDIKFINVILEHGYQWLCGNVDGFWNGNFMFPAKESITFSDNLLGNLPIYSFFRLFGLDEQSAFQGWVISFVFLNFLCGFYAFRYFTSSRWHALLGAFLFTFSLAVIGQYLHIQMAVRFMVPLFFVFAHKYFDSGRGKYLFIAALCFVMQFYICMYLGFFLLFCGGVYIFILLIYKFKTIRFNRKFFLTWGLAAISSALVLLPLILPYAERARSISFTPYEQVIPTIPTAWSYFRPFLGTTIWPYFESDTAGNPFFWLHFLFPGGLVMYSLLLLPVTLYIRKDRQLLFFAIVTFVILLCFLRIGNFSLVEYIREIPGMGSVRLVTRIINILIFFFVIVFIFTTRTFFSSARHSIQFYYFCLFMILAYYDNHNSFLDFKNYPKSETTQRITSIETEVREKMKGGTYESFAVLSDSTDEFYYNKWQIDAMMASYRLKLKTVNAYSSFCPPEFAEFWWRHNEPALYQWLKQNGKDTSKVIIIRR
jgi:hypothetical protein